jgi:hypothetical protein
MLLQLRQQREALCVGPLLLRGARCLVGCRRYRDTNSGGLLLDGAFLKLCQQRHPGCRVRPPSTAGYWASLRRRRQPIDGRAMLLKHLQQSSSRSSSASALLCSSSGSAPGCWGLPCLQVGKEVLPQGLLCTGDANWLRSGWQCCRSSSSSRSCCHLRAALLRPWDAALHQGSKKLPAGLRRGAAGSTVVRLCGCCGGGTAAGLWGWLRHTCLRARFSLAVRNGRRICQGCFLQRCQQPAAGCIGRG